MRDLIKDLIKDERGSSEIVETSISLQIILMLVFGFILIIMALRDDVILESAARSGAREYGITGSTQDAIRKGEEELRMGKVNAKIYFEGDNVVAEKTLKIRIPFMNEMRFGMKKKSLFHKESSSWYYDKEPYAQRGPIDGYSGYTGNPYN